MLYGGPTTTEDELKAQMQRQPQAALLFAALLNKPFSIINHQEEPTLKELISNEVLSRRKDLADSETDSDTECDISFEETANSEELFAAKLLKRRQDIADSESDSDNEYTSDEEATEKVRLK